MAPQPFADEKHEDNGPYGQDYPIGGDGELADMYSTDQFSDGHIVKKPHGNCEKNESCPVAIV